MTMFIIVNLSLIGCSNNDYNSEDYYTSLLSGEYGKGKFWTLNTILNGDTIQTEGFVRFDSKDLKDGDFQFIDVIPEDSYKEFKNVELSATKEGMTFSIEYIYNTSKIHITGIVSLGEMTVDMTLTE